MVLANKQDVKGAMDDLDIVERLNIETIVNRFLFHYKFDNFLIKVLKILILSYEIGL